MSNFEKILGLMAHGKGPDDHDEMISLMLEDLGLGEEFIPELHSRAFITTSSFVKEGAVGDTVTFDLPKIVGNAER